MWLRESSQIVIEKMQPGYGQENEVRLQMRKYSQIMVKKMQLDFG